MAKFEGPFHQHHIADYCTCPMYFRLREIDGIQPEMIPPYMFLGTVMHKIIGDLHRTKQLPFVGPTAGAIDDWEEEEKFPVLWKDRDAEIDAFIKDAMPILTNYWSKAGNCNAEIILSETEFTVDIGGFPFAGRIDQLRRRPDGKIILVDFKTGSSVASNMLLELGYQFSIYAYACKYGEFDTPGPDEPKLTLNVWPDFVGLYRTMDHLPYKQNGKTKTKTYQKGDERGPGLYLATRTEADFDAMIRDLGVICRNIVGPRYDAKLKHLVKGGAFGRMPSYVYGQVACDACSLKTECAAERRQAQGDTSKVENIISEEDFSYAEEK